ncbi:GntR family transcriptional regulator of abcA and norABC [Salibacterium salarium]|nr:GntR family transcriptional regulator of abcA and norABC [Salibacterium salarium]
MRESFLNEHYNYLKIVEYIEKKVNTGEWTAGRKLPSQRELAKGFGMNRSTVIHALEVLKDQELIESKAGSGTYVASQLSPLSQQINWNRYSKFSVHPSSNQAVKKINTLETHSNMIQLGKGELHPDLFPKKDFQKSLRSVADLYDAYGYNDGTGDNRLKTAVRSYLQENGVQYSTNSILIVSGALQALQLISLGLLQYGSNVFAQQTSYIHSLHVFRTTGMQMKGIPFHNNTLDTSYLEKQLRSNKSPSILYVNPTFHNPTTETMPLETKKEIAKLSKEYKIPVIEDDIFRDLWLDSTPPPPIASVDTAGHTLLVGSFSKTIALTLRIGWIAGPADVIEKLSDLRMQLDYGSSYLPQLAIYDFIASGNYEKHLQVLREKLRQRRDYFIHLLETHLQEVAQWNIPEGGLFIWVTFREEINIRKLWSQLIDNGIVVNPGFMYSPYPNQSIRLSYASCTEEEMKKGVLSIKKILQAWSLKT